MGNNTIVPFSFSFYISKHVNSGGHIANGSEVMIALLFANCGKL